MRSHPFPVQGKTVRFQRVPRFRLNAATLWIWVSLWNLVGDLRRQDPHLCDSSMDWMDAAERLLIRRSLRLKSAYGTSGRVIARSVRLLGRDEESPGSSGRHWRVHDGISENTVVRPQRFSVDPGMFRRQKPFSILVRQKSAPNRFGLSDRCPLRGNREPFAKPHCQRPHLAWSHFGCVSGLADQGAPELLIPNRIEELPAKVGREDLR